MHRLRNRRRNGRSNGGCCHIWVGVSCGRGCAVLEAKVATDDDDDSDDDDESDVEDDG